MPISLCLTNSCGSPSTVVPEAPQTTCTEMDRDRQNVNEDNCEKQSNSNKVFKKSTLPQFPSATVSMMYGSSKSKKYYNNASNRKKQQHIIDSLKSWNLNIAPSGLDKSEEESVAVTIASNQKKEFACPSASTCPNADGTLDDYEQDNRAVGYITESIRKTSSKKKVPEFIGNKFKPEEAKAEHPLAVVSKVDRDNATNEMGHKNTKHARSLESAAAEEGDVGSVVNNHAASSHLADTLTGSRAEMYYGRAGNVPPVKKNPTSLHPEFQAPSSFAAKANQQKHSHKSYVRSSSHCTAASPANVPISASANSSEKSATDGSRECKESGSGSTADQTHVSVMSLMLQGNSKQQQNEALRLKQFTSNTAVSSVISKAGHSNQHVVTPNQASYIPTLGSQNPSKQQVLIHNAQDHHQSLQQHNNTVPHQYSYDFLRDVGLKMSLCTVTNGASNNSSSGDIAMYRGSTSQVNYNFTQQFQQHMMQHHHNNQLHQRSSRQSPHQQQPLVQLHRIIPQHTGQYNRSQSMYGGDELATQQCGMVESQPYSNYALMNAGDGHNSMNVGKHFEVSSYLYNQNGGVHAQHQAVHYTQQAPEHHVQQMHTNYHQNNNYQYHNRNGNTGNGGGGNQLSYVSQGVTRAIGTVNGRDDQGRTGGGGGGGKKHWNTHGKGKNGSIQTNGNKHVNKVQNIGYGYRKNYNHYYNHTAAGGNHYYEHITMQPHQQQQSLQQQQQHHPQHHQNHYKQQHLHRNLVYVRGYDRGHGAASSSEFTNANQQQEIKQAEVERSTSPKQAGDGSAVEKIINSVAAKENDGRNESSSTDSVPSDTQQQQTVANNAFRGAEDVPDTTKNSELHIERVYKATKRCSVPRSSSSSSVVSIPSTDSSVLSSNTSQTHLLESTHANVHDYESDSSHSSEYPEGTYRYLKYNETNEEKGFRSSSSTSSGISSSSAYPTLTEFVPSAPSSLHASTAGLVGEFIVRSQSFHGSHQNLMTYTSSGGGSVGDHSPPIGSPKGTSRTVTGTQSVPVFGELFGNASHSHPNPIQFINSQTAGSFGSSSSLELALQAAAASSSSSSSLSASSVPPNDSQSMQSGHPKTRSQSGRTSPATNTHYRSHRSMGTNVAGSLFSTTTKGQSSAGGTVRKNNHVSMSYVHRSSLPADFQYTPADRFIQRADDVEMKSPPVALTDGSIWDNLSLAIWEKFTAAQQSEEKYLEKMQLWRDLYISIKKGFPKYSLYLVGSTISGFGADSSDVDMCLVSRSAPSCYDPRLEALLNLSLVKEYFMSMPSSSFNDFSLIQAKVPILRFQDSKHGIEVDLNFNNCVGIRNTHLLHCYSQMDWRVRPLVLVVKLWARHHNINDAKNMTISSYSLVLMVIHFLQYGTSPPVLPCLHALHPEKFMKIIDIHNIEMIERIEPYHTDNKESLGELLLSFLDYYTKFDYEHYAISVRTSTIIPIEECRLARSYKNDPHHWKHLCIEEPFDFTNTARSVFDGDVFEQIKSTFATSWRMLKDSKSLSVLFGEPLFTPVTSTLSITS
ncbi:poly(A) RNA polymerase gld-2 homolog B [Anopheles arabiensis]|uniref:Uncharacterized protein n=1 Tax=Anopheles arabiensis TaxID=7173 RepID=A0A182HK32_ANOAR|nr:poly(A) RNA polymerase gld-2 homolog B [Anopheles arabiensis]